MKESLLRSNLKETLAKDILLIAFTSWKDKGHGSNEKEMFGNVC
jgi:hypothetical protein